MSRQTEAALENDLIAHLAGLGYASVKIPDGAALVANLQSQLGAFNNTVFTDKEFDNILNHLAKGNIFEKAKTLRDRLQLTREDGSSFYVQFYNSEEWKRNLFQVTNQITQEGSYKNRYDVTLLVNGLPLAQIELKRRGLEMKEAFNQINRYQRHSFWSNHGLFQFVQLFVTSNGVNTKYLANNPLQSVKQTFYWADENNKNITDLTEFAAAFLNPDHLGKMIAQYIVRNVTHKIMMVLRPYQYYATEAIVHQVRTSNDNGYIWHTTGSGKTLTSFKASQILMDLPSIHKVVFVVDRKDLDYQTMNEFNAFKEGSVDVTDNTNTLVEQLTDDTKLVLTTIQKLNNSLKDRYRSRIKHLQDQKLVFIFDECHRSQFGDTHKRITSFFANSQLFGFTGTPIFADNASKNELGKRTTKDLFGKCLHKYVITDAIRDQNVLRFGIEYVGKYKNKSNLNIDIEVEGIDKQEVFNDPVRMEKIVDYLLAYHDHKTYSRNYSALFAVSKVDHAIAYYDIFKRKKEAGEHDLRIATIFTYAANPDDPEANDYIPGDIGYSTTESDMNIAADAKVVQISQHKRDKLESYIADYNKMYNTSFNTKDGKAFENYFNDISKRLKNREKKTFNDEKDRLDLVIVVNMMLTGFDAKKVNTLYVDKNLKQHGLIQAFSRTNRTWSDQKSQGNILCFRNLKKSTDDAITLFSNKEAIEEILIPDYKVIAGKFDDAFKKLKEIAPTIQSVSDLLSEDEEAAFVKAFRRLIRHINALKTYVDFSWDDLPMEEQEFEDYASAYKDLYNKVKKENSKQTASILNDIDFELELIHRDRINRAYILQLLAKLKLAKKSEVAAQHKAIMDMLGGEVMMYSKRELIEKFIEENLPYIENVDDIDDEFEQYWREQKVLGLDKICEEEQLDKEQFAALIETYLFSGQEPGIFEVRKCLKEQPSALKANEIGKRIVAKMREYMEVFVHDMVG